MLYSCYLFIRRKAIKVFRMLSNWKFSRFEDEERIRCVQNKQLLTRAQKKEIKNYYKSYPLPSFPVVTYYVEKTGCFKPNYLSDGYYQTKIDMFSMTGRVRV